MTGAAMIDNESMPEDADHPNRKIERGIGRKFWRARSAGTGMTLTAEEIRVLDVTDFGAWATQWADQ